MSYGPDIPPSWKNHTMTPAQLTISHAQENQPWTLPYSHGVNILEQPCRSNPTNPTS
jgi:hypothetical protein